MKERHYKCKAHNYYGFEYGEVYKANNTLDYYATAYPSDWEKIDVDIACPTSKIDSFADSVFEVTDSISKMLIEKNRKYGNSALNPARVFSKSDAVEQLKVRIDDKISRMSSGQVDDDEDVVDDLIGYLILLKIAKNG